MLRATYNLVAWLAQPLLRRKLLRRAQAEPGYGQHVNERFGQYEVARPDGDGPLVWIHAVSLGETRAAAILLTALRERVPGMRLLLTNGTATGRAEGEKLLRPGDLQVWQPWDERGAVRRFFAHFRPDMGVLMETEIWPNLLFESSEQGIPVALANARLSEKSLRAAERGAWLMRPAYGALAAAWAQTEDDAKRLRAIGANRVSVLGNLKFDAQPDHALIARGRAWRAAASKPVVMLASSREGEEAEFLKNLGQAPVQWLIVPRHPQRFDEVAELVRAHGLSLSRRSSWGEADTPSSADVWLGDSLGEMAAYYSLADVALLGGSFEPLGGQNLIEAAACGCPVLMGPHTFNFHEAAHLAENAGAAKRVPDISAALSAARYLVGDVAANAAMRDAGLAFAAEHRGAAVHMADAVALLLSEK
ncbi:3-deoxy-D-manno-octulosonic acid transferase [Ottowia thiooxydans]|uniref:3-deoxy-D-manno-octulosonic acid transferase n=1 Tax=Ottowia thiooxydans TaxID=219182 RepID=UPI00040448F1|nr:3-deoxy-D-manno-octulosonic acid transferase [Ottowia thiooxydans]